MSSEEEYDYDDINANSLDILDEDCMQSTSEEDEKYEEVDVQYARAFTEHTNELYCLALSVPTGLAVTGSGDDSAIVWFIHDCSLKFVCKNHIDSVVSAEFHQNGNALFTADMMGTINLWRTDSGNLLYSFNVSETLLWSTWVPQRAEIVAGCTDGTIWQINVKNKRTNCLPHVGASSSVAVPFFSDNSKMAIGYDDGHVAVWDFGGDFDDLSVVKNSARWNFKEEISCDGVLSLDWNEKGQLLAVGFQSGIVRLLLLPNKILNEYKIESEGDCGVEAVKFNKINELELLYCGANCGIVVCFDVTHTKIRFRIDLKRCLTKLIVWRDLYFVSTACGAVCVLNGLTGEEIRVFQPHCDLVTDFAVFGFPGGITIVTCCVDSTARIIEF